MKNNSIEISIADMVEIDPYSVWVRNDHLDVMIAQAYGVNDDTERKKFMARVTIKIEDLSEPLRIERPEEPAESEAQE